MINSGKTLCLATYNIWNSDDGMPYRAVYISRELQKTGADIICLQEIKNSALAGEIADRSGKNYCFVNYKNEILQTSISAEKISTIASAIKEIFNNYLSKTSTIVYFSSKAKMVQELLDYINNEPDCEDEELQNLAELVKSSVHEKYFLIQAA